MWPKIRRFLIGLLVILVIALAALGVFVKVKWQGWVEAGFPQTDGEITIPGLDGPVDVYRDEYGIPHIYATTEHDLYVAQGYVHAQDRFWQMDFQRHTGTGRLSELLGSIMLENDKFLRTVGWERVAREELKLLDAETLAMLEAYSEGVNAYLADHEGAELGFEYVFVNVLNSGYEPKPWEPVHTIVWAKAMAWQLRSNMDVEIDRAIMLSSLTTEQIAELFPPYPEDRPYIVNDQSGFTNQVVPVDGLSLALASHVSPALEQVAARFALADSLFGGKPTSEVGSNSWAVSGDLTNTGMPLLANDPHLPASLPHIWYQVGLHCLPKNEDCPLDMTGFSLLGIPAVVIGHTDRIAWGLTNVGADVMDLYIEKINPDNPLQYEVNGEWVDMEIITETIRIGKNKTEEFEVFLTRHGPIITDVYGLEDFAEESGVDLPENYAIALRWTVLEPNELLKAIRILSQAQDWEDFREAAKVFVVPAQNFLYADVDGNIGYQMPGKVPIRAGDSDGRYPVPGWTDEHEWLGYIPFEELPYAFNPPEGYIVAANQAVVDDTYPYHIADFWAYGNRAQRIADMIVEAPGLIDIAYFRQMQGDNKNLGAEELAPVLLEVSFEDAELVEARALLEDWDYQQHMDSPAAALFNVFWKHLLIETFMDELPEDMIPSGNDRWFIVMRSLVADPTNRWWDDQDTEDVETMEDIFRTAFTAAVKDMKKAQGDDPDEWNWGGLHTFYLSHDVMGNFPLLNKAFERGPFPVSGGSSIVNATGWSAASDGYQVSGGVPSFRMIVDLGELSNSLVIYPTGQSGHPYNQHYIDMIDLWRNIEYISMLWDLEDVQEEVEGHLRLVP